MKKSLWLSVVVATLSLIMWARPTLAETRQLITNGNFESDPATNWVSSDYAWVTSTYNSYYNPIPSQGIVWASGGMNTGVGNHYISLGTHTSALEVVSQMVMLPSPDATIVVKMQFIKDASTLPGKITLEAFGAARGVSCDAVAPNDAVGLWTDLQCTLPARSHGQVNIIIKSYAGTRAYIDNVSVTANIPDPQPADAPDEPTIPVTPTPVVTDQTGPTLDVVTPGSGSIVAVTPITIKGWVSDQSGIKELYFWDQGVATHVPWRADGYFETTYAPKMTDNWLVFVAVDSKGNETRKTYELKYAPRPRVLGLSTTASTITVRVLKNGKFQIKNNGKAFTIQPFPGYRGGIYTKRIELTPSEVYFVFAATDAGDKGGLAIYNQNGKRTDRNKPFGNFKPGYNVTISTLPDSQLVFLAIAPKKWGKSVSIFEIANGKFKFIRSVAVATKTTGDVRVKFIPLGHALYLGAALNGRPATLKSWAYSAMAGQFSRTSSQDKHLRLISGQIGWR